MSRHRTARPQALLTFALAIALALFGLVGVVGCSCEDDPDVTGEQATDAEGAAPDDGDEATDGDSGSDADGTDATDDDAGDGDGVDDEGDGDPLTVYLYFSYGGDRALRVERTIEYTQAPATAVMTGLLAGPTDAETTTWPLLATNIPDGTELLGLTIDDGVATVDLSGEFDDGGGTFSVTARLAEVVYTLCQFDSVDSVLFKVDGAIVEMFSGEGLMLDGEPQTPDDYDDLVPVDA